MVTMIGSILMGVLAPIHLPDVGEASPEFKFQGPRTLYFPRLDFPNYMFKIILLDAEDQKPRACRPALHLFEESGACLSHNSTFAGKEKNNLAKSETLIGTRNGQFQETSHS